MGTAVAAVIQSFCSAAATDYTASSVALSVAVALVTSIVAPKGVAAGETVAV